MPTEPQVCSISQLKGLGKKSEEMLSKVGIDSVDAFLQADPFEIYRQLHISGCSVSLNLLYAMIGAQENIDWRKVAAERKTAILMQLDDMGIAP